MNDINIVFVNYHMKNDTLRAIESVISDTKNSSYSIAITVVDNSQNADGLQDSLRQQFPSVTYRETPENIGFGRANTLGFQTVPARYYFALNPDTQMISGARTVDAIIEFMDRHPKIGCIGPKLINMDGTLQYACYRFDLSSILIKPLRYVFAERKNGFLQKRIDTLLMKDFDHQQTQPVDWVLGAAMVVRKEVIDDIGWFDERYFMYMEDCDWCRTMWEQGWPVYYVHDIVVRHRYTRASAQVSGVVRALLQNRMARSHVKSWWGYIWKWRRTHKFYA